MKGARCVHCGTEVKRLLIHYSPGNIRLIKCGSCNMVADPYVECEIMILLIDLILHKEKAYRHLLYNMLDEGSVARQGLLLKSAVGYLVLELCRSFIICRTRDDWHSSTTFFPILVIGVLLANATFFAASYILIRILCGSLHATSWKETSLAFFLSSYMKIFMLAMMIWEFPTCAVFIIDMFVLSSNAVALRVLMELPNKEQSVKCFGVFLAAYAFKMFAFGSLLPPPNCNPILFGLDNWTST